jgi:hypothetical protein
MVRYIWTMGRNGLKQAILPTLVVMSAFLLMGAKTLPQRAAEARALYENLEFEKAAAAFEALAKDNEAGKGQRAEWLIWAAMCHAGLSNDAKAEDAIKRAVMLDVNVDVPEAAPPKIRDWVAVFKEDPPKPEKKEEAATAPQPSGNREVSIEDYNRQKGLDGAEENEALFYYATGGAVALVGVLAGATGGWLVLTATETASIRENPNALQREVVQAQDLANLQLAAAYGSFTVSALCLAGAAALITIPHLEEEEGS